MKEIIDTIIILVTGVWLITMCFIMNTSNITSAVIFKVIPFFLGLGCLYVVCRMVGFIP